MVRWLSGGKKLMVATISLTEKAKCRQDGGLMLMMVGILMVKEIGIILMQMVKCKLVDGSIMKIVGTISSQMVQDDLMN